MTEPSPRDVVFTFSLETLADARDRAFARPPGRLLQTLLASRRVGRVLVVDAERWVGSILRHGRQPWPAALGEPQPHLRPRRWRRRASSDLTSIRSSVRRLDTVIRQAVDRHGLHRPALVTFDPLLAGFGDATWSSAVTYYGRDDWASYPPRRDWWPAYEHAYQGLRDTARGVLTISEPLRERIAPTGPSAVIPNGIDPDEWRDPGPPPAWLAGLPRPILTYIGTVDHRVDENLLAPLFEMPGTVTIVGPTRDPGLSERLAQRGAVLGEGRDRAEVAAILAHSDVGLIPHQPSSLTAAMSPLKLYEYRAAGLPVATVDLAPVAAEAGDDPAILLAANGPDGYAEAVTRAIAQGRDDETTRAAYLLAMSWARRHEAALEVILR